MTECRGIFTGNINICPTRHFFSDVSNNDEIYTIFQFLFIQNVLLFRFASISIEMKLRHCFVKIYIFAEG